MILIIILDKVFVLFTDFNKCFWVIEVVNNTGEFGPLQTQPTERSSSWLFHAPSSTFLWIQQHNVSAGSPNEQAHRRQIKP